MGSRPARDLLRRPATSEDGIDVLSGPAMNFGIYHEEVEELRVERGGYRGGVMDWSNFHVCSDNRVKHISTC